MKACTDTSGYLYVILFKNWKQNAYSIHRLLALAFIPNPENKPQVNHIDWDKKNNNLENLEWVTISENHKHAYAIWLKKLAENHQFRTNPVLKWKYWKDNPCSRPVSQLTKNGAWIRDWESMKYAGMGTGASKNSISACCRWKAKTAWWFKWAYAEDILQKFKS